MSTSSETQCLHSDIIVKSLKQNEFISLLRFHSDLVNELHPTFVLVKIDIAVLLVVLLASYVLLILAIIF